MKKIMVLVALLLIGLVVFNVPAAAQSGPNNTAGISVERPSLAIKAPQLAYVGEKVKMKVVELPGGAPVSGAGVWAVDIKNAGNIPSASSSELNETGIFLGWTDDFGGVTYAFHGPGRYLLIAFKDGYLPGFAWIAILPLKAMAIKAPQSAFVGQTVEFDVYEPDSGAAIAGVGVWALLIQDEAALTNTSQEDTVTLVTTNGIFLGYTNNLGQVFHAFEKAGPYLLVAIKQGYKPAFGKIAIKDLKEMVIRAPEVVWVLEPVTIRVVEKSVLTVEIPVAKAEVWAVNYVNTLDSLSNYEAVKNCGLFLGWTDEQGYISPKPYFKEAGQYYLVAFKTGFVPGVSKIKVEPLKEMAIKAPQSAFVGQTVEFDVYEPDTGAAVGGAGVWALLNQDETQLTGSSQEDILSFVKTHGIFLGYTNNLGQVFHAFDKTGQYLLVAVKQGYKPAFGKIGIKEVKELAIRAPDVVYVLQPVTIRVVEKSVLPVEIPVQDAAVWAINTENKSNLNDVTDYAALLQKSGIFLGWTNAQGYVSPQPRFNQAGQYWLVAIKDGYAPGVSSIAVKPLETATPVPKVLSVKPAPASSTATGMKNK
jgi:hypothetical protein